MTSVLSLTNFQGQAYQKIRSSPQPFLVAVLMFAFVLNAVASFHQLVSTPFPLSLTCLVLFFLMQ